jgi:hypothetical protein
MMRSLHLQYFLVKVVSGCEMMTQPDDFYFRKARPMKPTTLFASLLTLSVLTPALALAAVNCEPKNTQDIAQRNAYIKQCLAESASPANVQRVAEQQKKMSCEQNAMNKDLQGTAKADYIARCVFQDDAKEAAAATAASKKGAPASLEQKYSARDSSASVH